MPAQVSPNYIYLDYAATAPLCEEAAEAMAGFLVPGRANVALGANANSLHTPGRASFEAMENARRQFTKVVGARRPDEIVFTCGATEADDAAIIGIAQAEFEKRRRANRDFVGHIVTTELEHEAVLEPVRRLRQNGFEVTFVRPNRAGFIEPEALKAAITSSTVLVSVQMVNSEVGSVQPIAKLAKVAHDAGALFHTDATQALGKAPFNVQDLAVDAASLSAHKVGGPKGVGALYLKNRTPFTPYLLGGGQEAGRRSGTQNVAGIAGFVAAAQASVSMLEEECTRLRALRDKAYAGATQLGPVRATVNVPQGSADYAPHVVHLLVSGLESETLILRLDARDIAVSGGSACSTGSLEPSHVLTAMGVSANDAYGALRVSMGRYTTEQDIDAFISALREVVNA